MKKGRILAWTNLDRYTPAVRTASDGLRNDIRGHFESPNVLPVKDIFTTISTLGWGGVFPHLISIEFLFPLRVPSEDLQLRRAFADDPIAEFITHHDKALIGVRPFERTGALII